MELYSVLVTGANRGIGLEFVKQLLQSNKPPRYLFGTYRSRNGIEPLKKLRDTAPEGTLVYLIKMDVREASEIESMKKIVEDLVGDDGLTLLINNAGASDIEEPFPGTTVENLSKHFSINSIGPLMVAQAMYPLLKKAACRQKIPEMSFSRAAILNISSSLGSIANTGENLVQFLVCPGYLISKAALNMGMRIVAAKVKEDNILVIMMCPGWVKTDMGSEGAELEATDSIAAMLNTISKLNESHHGTYMDRLGQPIPW